MLSHNSNKQILRLSITLKIRNSLNSPYFKYLQVILSTQLATNVLVCF